MDVSASTRRESILIGSWAEMVNMPAYEIKKSPHTLNTSMVMPAHTRRESTMISSWSQIVAMCEKTAANIAAEERHGKFVKTLLQRINALEVCVNGGKCSVSKAGRSGVLRRLEQLEVKVLPGGRTAPRRGDSGALIDRLERLEHTVALTKKNFKRPTNTETSTQEQQQQQQQQQAKTLTQIEWGAMKTALAHAQKADRELNKWERSKAYAAQSKELAVWWLKSEVNKPEASEPELESRSLLPVIVCCSRHSSVCFSSVLPVSVLPMLP
jgi:hypothetical protein